MSLYDKLYSYDTLWQSWLQVKKKKSAGGIDKISVFEFDLVADEQIKQIQKKLSENIYLPQPYKSAYIKKNKKEFRSLGLLSICDKIVQQSINTLIYPIIDNQLSSNCYAYRHKKGAVKAVGRVRHMLNHENCQYMISCDIKSYFDNLSHKILFDMLHKPINDNRLLNLIELCVRMGKVQKETKWRDSEKGVPQGGVISPLLANLYLTPLDKNILKNDFSYVRYADDFVVLCKTYVEAQKVIGIIKNTLTNLKLQLKEEPQIKNITEGFTFLGIDFLKKELKLNSAKKARMIEKVNLAFKSPRHEILNQLTKQLNGYKAFYSKIFPSEKIRFIDECVLDNISTLAAKENTKNPKVLIKMWGPLNFITDKYNQEKFKNLRKIATEFKATNSSENIIKNETDKLISKRKREYQKLEAHGKELIINSFGTYLGIRSGKVFVKNKTQKNKAVPLENLSHITILTNGVSFSSDFVYQCTQKQIPVSFFTRKGKHYSTLYSPFVTNTSLWQKQLIASTNTKGSKIAILLIQAKIRNQANLLKYFHKYHKNSDEGFAKLFSKKISTLSSLSKNCKDKSIINSDNYRQELMAIEAQAANIYWELVAELINDDTEFAGRKRKGAKDIVNSMLNYGYAIIYARVWKALIGAKLNPHISFLHVSSSSKPTFAFDFIEIFRQQAVDRVVISLLQKKEKISLKNDQLDEATRAKLVENIFERLHRYEKYRGEKRRFSDIIELQARDLANYIDNKSKTYKPYIAKW